MYVLYLFVYVVCLGECIVRSEYYYKSCVGHESLQVLLSKLTF